MVPKIAIIGGGAVGHYLASLLHLKDYSVTLFETKSAWERQLGTGIFSSSSIDLPILEEFSSPHQITSLKLFSPSGKSATMELPQSYRLYTPEDLEEALKERFKDFEGRVISGRVLEVKRVEGMWQIHTPEGVHEANFIIGADGISSLVRKSLGFLYPAENITMEVSVELPQDLGQEATIQFFDNIPGYFWIFPRMGRTVAGLWGTSQFLQARHLFEKMDILINNTLQVPVAAGIQRHVAHLPTFGKFTPREVAGAGWALVGEAAGLIDPLSCEGLYWALKSASLLADSFDQKSFSAKRYLGSLSREVIPSLRKRQFLRKILYRSWVLNWLIPKVESKRRTQHFFRTQFLPSTC